MKTHDFERALEEKSMVACIFFFFLIYIGGFEAEWILDGRLERGDHSLGEFNKRWALGCQNTKKNSTETENFDQFIILCIHIYIYIYIHTIHGV